ncbi:MAG TPA: dipeptidase, partial [Pseudodesulfovibrio sp.]|nr:dipeptidase [Pseudodesulfovibrio sp.]
EALAAIPELDKAVANSPEAERQRMITEFGDKTSAKVLSAWKDLTYTLFAKYSDGYINLSGSEAKAIGYPASWLNATDYGDGPTTYDMK